MKPLDASAADISRSDAFRAIAAVGRDKDGLWDDPSSARPTLASQGIGANHNLVKSARYLHKQL